MHITRALSSPVACDIADLVQTAASLGLVQSLWLFHCTHSVYDLEAVGKGYFDNLGFSYTVADKGGSMRLFC
jgi:hypothetical protein